MSKLAVTVAGLPLEFPVMLGSGPLGVRAKDLLEFGRVAGGIVTKSITPEPCAGSPTPRIVKVDQDAMLNYEGNPNPGSTILAIRFARLFPRYRVR